MTAIPCVSPNAGTLRKSHRESQAQAAVEIPIYGCIGNGLLGC